MIVDFVVVVIAIVFSCFYLSDIHNHTHTDAQQLSSLLKGNAKKLNGVDEKNLEKNKVILKFVNKEK